MKVLEVSIYGNKYRVKSGLDELFLKEAARLVEENMRNIERDYRILTTSKIAVMTAFNLAADYLKLKEDLNYLKQKLDSIEKRLDSIK